MTCLQKKTIFLHNHPKTLFFRFFFPFSFSIFSYFPFYFFQHKKTKQKVHIFFQKPFFWQPDKLPKNYFRTPTHYLWFLRYPKNTVKLGETSKNKSWTKFWCNLGPSFDSKNPNRGPSFDSTAYIYICWCWRVLNWTPFFHPMCTKPAKT